MKVVLIDNFDSFTFNLYQQVSVVLKELCHGEKAEVKVLRNNNSELLALDFASLSAIIISPGPGGPEDTGYAADVIKKAIGKVAILGVCLGHQLLADMAGAKVIRAKRPVHGRGEKVNLKSGDSVLFAGVPKYFTAARYHSLIVEEDSLPVSFNITATAASDNAVMAIEDKERKLFGIQFHPESFLSEYGDTIIKNFLKFSFRDKL
jgi:anthranilate synthase component 2